MRYGVARAAIRVSSLLNANATANHFEHRAWMLLDGRTSTRGGINYRLNGKASIA